MLRVTHTLQGGDWCFLSEGEAYWIPIKKIAFCSLINPTESHRAIHGPQPRYPMYTVTMDDERIYIIHSDETERMVRVIRGEENPLVGFVDELRNHPLLGVYPAAENRELLNTPLTPL